MLAAAFVEGFCARGQAAAILDEAGRPTSYAELHAAICTWRERIGAAGARAGETIALEGSYSLDLIACFWAAAALGQIVVPLTAHSVGRDEEYLDLAEVRHSIAFDHEGRWRHERRDAVQRHDLLRSLRERGESGLILFSSGTAGKSKAVLHDLGRLLAKYRHAHKAMRTLLFLVFDHIAGLDTLFYTLAAGGCCVLESSRQPEAVCRAIARHQVEVLAATPSFFSLLLTSEANEAHDLSSLKVVAYGSEPMPAHVLARLARALPGARLIQKYGMTELGSPSSRSRDSETPWMKIGGEATRTKVVEGVLWIKSASAMLGYLNAPSPFDADGWLNTGDLVEVQGEWMRVLGRRSEMINVGGEKVHPAEVENVLLQVPNVATVTVSGEPNALMGQIVVARVTTAVPQGLAELKRAVREFCRGRLAPYQVPAKLVLAEGPGHSHRFKKTRE